MTEELDEATAKWLLDVVNELGGPPTPSQVELVRRIFRMTTTKSSAISPMSEAA